MASPETTTASSGFSPTVVNDITSWETQYKNQNIGMMHDESMFELVSPDDSIIVAGPSRLYNAANTNTQNANSPFYVIGVCQSFNFTESSQIQPMKAIGSRRHIFTRTNQPVQASIARLMFYGPNLVRALYKALADGEPYSDTDTTNNQYIQGNASYETLTDEVTFLTNLEEDLYRTAFGIGIIYHTPKTAHFAASDSGAPTGAAMGAEYLEYATIQSRNVSFQSGQTIVMEQVQLMADRVVPWNAYYHQDLSTTT
jgi:hypothetical protein